MSYTTRHREELKNIRSSALIIRHIEAELKWPILMQDESKNKRENGFLNYLSKFYH